MNHTSPSVLIALAVAGAITTSRASAAWYEPFDYTADASSTALSLGNGSNQNPQSMDAFAGGGTGGSIWTPSAAPAAVNDADVASGSLSYPGLPWTPAGNKAAIQAASQKFDRIMVDQNYGGGSGGPVVYYSMLIRATSMNGMTATGANGGFFTGLQYYPLSTAASDNMSTSAAGSAAPILIRRADAGDLDAGYQLGIGFRDIAIAIGNPGVSRVFDGTTNYTPLDTLFLVAKYEMGDPNMDFDDRATLWVFRDDGTTADPVPLTEPGTFTVQSANFSGNAVHDYFFNNTSGIQLESNVRSIIVRGGNGFIPEMEIDEINVGSSWAAVTPEPGGLGLLCMGALGMLRRKRK